MDEVPGWPWSEPAWPPDTRVLAPPEHEPDPKTDLDVALIALAWWQAKPFEEGQRRSTHPRTQRVIETYLAGPRDSLTLVKTMSSAEVRLVLRAAAARKAPAPWSEPKPPPPPVKPPLAPIDPDAFLAWASGSGWSLTDAAFDLGVDEADLHRAMVSLAAHVRRNQRLGLTPAAWLGNLGRWMA